MGVPLQDGSRVAIIGGGPAGSFAALHLLDLARARGLRLEVLLFEPRDPFTAPGPRSCKGCAGILSAGLVRHMASLGLSVPAAVVQSELSAYVVHVYGHVTSIAQPDARRRILSVYRGAGPLRHAAEPIAGFDTYLLGQACARGARHVPARVRHVEWQEGRPTVFWDGDPYPADLLLLATGVNSRPPLSPAFGYRPPSTMGMAQDEVWRPPNWPAHKVAGFFGEPRGLVFGAIVPKGPYLNVSLLWPDAGPDAIAQFFAAQQDALRRFWPDGLGSYCGCNPRIAVKPSPAFYGDRWAAVGDASVARLYKDGIHSAYLSARAAARTVLERGVGREDFAAGYAPFCRRVAADNEYGWFLYRASSRLLRAPAVARGWLACMAEEARLPVERRLQARVMWGLLTGDESYRTLFWLLMRPRAMARLGLGVAGALRPAT